MYINGTIYTKVDINATDMIEEICKNAGIIDSCGRVVIHPEKDDKTGKDVIAVYDLDIFDKSQRRVLYDKPFDVEYAQVLSQLWTMTHEYEKLKNADIDGSEDYQTAQHLGLRRRQSEK